jgi:uncharacterized protein YecE (DUF72 family)
VTLAPARALAEAAPVPAQVGNVSTGTAGWTDPSLIRCKRFYPPNVNTPEQRLSYYASQFSFVEVDASYYALLDPAVAAKWLSTTPEPFRFHVKAHASLTGHPVELKRLPRSIRDGLDPALLAKGRVYPPQLPQHVRETLYQAFADSVEPLLAANRLSSVLLQFPPWFRATRGGARQIDELRDRFGGLPLSVEFRHASWMAAVRRERVLAWLTSKQLGYVIVDEPFESALGGVPPIVAVTRSELAIFRFHGHNTAGWRRGAKVSERFNYLYNEAELTHWLKPVRRVSKQAERVDVVFNNCVEDYATLNAKSLSGLLLRPEASDPPDA